MSLGKKKIQMGSAAKPIVNTENFGIELYNHSSSSTVTFDFAPDLFWIKSRGGDYNHLLFDSVRGIDQPNDYYIQSDTTNAEVTTTNRFSLSNGGKTMTIPSGSNVINSSAGSPYVVWGWKAGGSAVSNTDGDITSQVSANQAAGFSIVSYTGNNTNNATVGHGLSSTPEMIIVKNLDLARSWGVWHTGLASGEVLRLDATTEAQTPTTAYFQDELNTANVFGLGTNDETNSTDDYIAYCFHSVDGYQKVGSYTGTGAAGNAQNIGFQPRYLMTKTSSSAGGRWFILDSARSTGNPKEDYLMADGTLDEGVADGVTFTSTGFEFSDGSYNQLNYEFIYLAIA